jgi:ABC-type transport system involved in cytochrome bd biosynthesis fused ATPase/permease subunit
VLTGRPVLVLDEPTSHLDQATAGAVLEAVMEHARGRSVLWVTHRPAELALFPDVRHLRGGMEDELDEN